MPLEMLVPRDKFKIVQGFVSEEAVLSHLKTVLESFAAKPEYSRFYIGITKDIDQRLREHRADKAKQDFKLMFPVVEEESPDALAGNFDGLERAAIRRFNPGILNLRTNKLLRCMNDQPGVAPKCILYVLVG